MSLKFTDGAMRHFSSSNKILIVEILEVLFVALFFLPRIIPYPELDDFLRRDYSTRFYDRNGNLLQITKVDIEGTKREWKPISDFPKQLQKIVLKAEDSRFYFHGGVDYISATKAMFQNISARRTVRGASTISMQLAHLVSGSEKNRSLWSKICDIVNAYRIEAKLSKGQILELYLNNVPFGSGIEGFPSAARYFFGAEINALTTEQIFCLAVIPRRPSLYNPILNPEKCAEAAERLLQNSENRIALITKNFLLHQRFVKKMESTDSILKTATSASPYQYPYYMPHYIRHVQSQKKSENTTTSKKLTSWIFKDSHKNQNEVHLSTDLRLYEKSQQFLEIAFKNTNDSRIENAAILVIENKTGDVLCWISRGEFDGVIHQMQPGSSMKPMLYALALENGFRPNMVLADTPVEFGGENLYIPTNFNNRYNGPVRFRVALASSLNVPAVKILDKIGIEKYEDFLIDAGVNSLKDERNHDPGLQIALGGAEITLEELTRAFTIFPNDGFFFGKKIIDSDTARLICSILSDKASRALGFGYTQTFETDFPAIFKTGTANQYQNITALGATKKYTVGVWMGNFSGETVVGKTGSSLPANIARQILEYIDGGTGADSIDFPEPENYEKIKICSLSGMTSGKNCPYTVFEYAKKGEKNEECTWHTEHGTTYPSEYENWLLNSVRDGDVSYGNLPLEIKTPQDGAVFYYDPQNLEMQAIPVEVTGGSTLTANFIYDGNALQEKSRPFIFSLPIERGKHTLEVVTIDERKTVEFEVK